MFPLAVKTFLVDNEFPLVPLSMMGSKNYVSILPPQEEEIYVLLSIEYFGYCSFFFSFYVLACSFNSCPCLLCSLHHWNPSFHSSGYG